MKREKINVALLEETHSNDKKHEQFRREWVGWVYYSSFTICRRGVAILINKNTPCTLNKCIGYVLINGVLYGENITTGCIYAPNVYQGRFFSKLLSDVSSLSSSYTKLAGDFNCIVDPEADRYPLSMAAPSKMARAMREVCSELELLDAHHPKEKDYTFY